MSFDDKKIELLAPAGNMLCLRAAVVNGADAVYLGAPAFSARAKADNFSNEDLAEAVKYCHLYSVKVYLAVNTILKPNEYEKAKSVIQYAKSVGVDAFIVQDWAFIEYLHTTMPDITVHLSTQSGIHNLEGANVARNLGVSRIVLSREATISDIKKIHAAVDVEIEAFVQGALCVSFSGNCYLSSLATGNSGNRGRCLQFCRKKYSCGNFHGYLLSAKDINNSDVLSKMIDAGVRSLKIEGRMRRPEFVAAAVKHYRSLLSGGDGYANEVKRIFNRGDYCSAYLNNPTETVIYPKVQGHIGQKIATVERATGKTAYLSIKTPLNKGDGIKFIRNGYEVGSALVAETGKSVSYSGSVKSDDEVYITTDIALNESLMSVERKIPVDLSLSLCNNGIECIAKCGESVVKLSSGEILQKAIKSPLIEDDLRKCFQKTGDAVFGVRLLTVKIDDKYFLSKSMLNDFRRRVYCELEREILLAYSERVKAENCGSTIGERGLTFSAKSIIRSRDKTVIQTDRAELIEELLNYCNSVAYFPNKYDASVVKIFEKYGKKLYLVLPVIARGEDISILKEILSSEFIKRVIINNPYGYEIAKDKEIIVGTGLNVINPDYSDNCIMSVEYDGKSYGNNFAYVYGKYPIMSFAHCPKKTVNGGKCQNCNLEKLTYVDESGKKFDIRFYRISFCYAQMHNCVPINLLDKINSMDANRYFIDLIGSDASEIYNVLGCLDGHVSITGDYTRGYYSKKLL